MIIRHALTPTLLVSAMLLAGCSDSGDDDPVVPLDGDTASAAEDGASVVVTPDDADPFDDAPDSLATEPTPGPGATGTQTGTETETETGTGTAETETETAGAETGTTAETTTEPGEVDATGSEATDSVTVQGDPEDTVVAGTEPGNADPVEPAVPEADDGAPVTSSPQTPPAGTPPTGNVPAPSSGSLPLPDDLVDNSPTRAESLSLLGPSSRDASRPAGPPSAPSDLTALLLAGDYVEFTWAPSVDDGSVVAYEIYRDGEFLRTVEDSDSVFYEHKNWLSTSYIDCNYTRDAVCEVQQPASGSTHEYYVVAVDDEGLSSEPSAPATFTLTPQSASALDLSGYSVIFADEFDGDSLDRAKWKTALPWGPDTTINGEQQYYANLFGSDPIAYDPFVFNGDTMSITGVPTPPELSDAANGQPYLSGNLTTADNFSMTYGYVEMNAKLASGPGLLSTFYLFNADYEKNKPEIDIVEYIGDRPTIAYQTYHYYDSLLLEENGYQGVKHSTPTMAADVGSDLGSEFHTYGVLWEPELMVWYIDGVEVQRVTGPRVPDEPMNIIAHLVIGSSWIGEPNAANFPVEFEIDYIRAYQR